MEVTRRLVDLFFVSVLLDAGAGEVWSFTEPESGNKYVRSEGIAIAAMAMLNGGAFSSQPGETPAHVDGEITAPVMLDLIADFNRTRSDWIGHQHI